MLLNCGEPWGSYEKGKQADLYRRSVTPLECVKNKVKSILELGWLFGKIPEMTLSH